MIGIFIRLRIQTGNDIAVGKSIQIICDHSHAPWGMKYSFVVGHLNGCDFVAKLNLQIPLTGITPQIRRTIRLFFIENIGFCKENPFFSAGCLSQCRNCIFTAG